MFDLSRLARALGLSVGLAASAASVGAVAVMRRPLPRVSGRATLVGLNAQATVRRDRWGVPHISAASNGDLFAALGYVHAQDRLWQMELNRRTGHGCLAELFGPVALSSDQFIRTLGFSRIARAEVDLLDEETRATLEAYLRGVNGWIEAHRGRLPLEFSLLGLQAQPWELADLLVWPKVMALNLGGNWMSELFNAQVAAALGSVRAAELNPHYPPEAPIAVPPGTFAWPDLGAAALRRANEAARFTGDSTAPQGSNAWVVSGARSSTGRPLLANDPHLGLGLPGIWYAAHLEGGDYHVAGVTFPGFCGVVIGHNPQIAWGVTAALTDTQDLYLERLHPEQPDRYLWQGEWRELERVREEIIVKGQRSPSILEVRLSHHGPLLDEVSSPADSPLHSLPATPRDPAATSGEPAAAPLAIALRWTALEPTPASARAVLRLNRATDWASFRAALEDWDVAPQNFIYADVNGHYGYALGGRLPIRAQGDGQLPVPGWDGAYEWTGYLPNAELPASLDPPDGFAVTANNRIAAPDHPHFTRIQGDYANPYRAERISELLAATPLHDLRSFARIQNDLRSLPGVQLARLVTELTPSDRLEQTARDLLAAWDGDLTAESVPATIYAGLRHHLLRVVYTELEALFAAQAALGAFASLPANTYLDRALPMVLARMEAAPLPERSDAWLGGGRTWLGVLGEALSRTTSELCESLGSNPTRWSYGRIHSLTLRHPLGAVAALAPLFNRGPWPTGGDIDTVNHHFIPRDSVSGPRYNGPSYRQIIDPGDWDSARIIMPAGQSGHPASSHYADMNAAWRAGGYFPLLWTPEAVERHTVASLTLEPG